MELVEGIQATRRDRYRFLVSERPGGTRIREERGQVWQEIL